MRHVPHHLKFDLPSKIKFSDFFFYNDIMQTDCRGNATFSVKQFSSSQD